MIKKASSKKKVVRQAHHKSVRKVQKKSVRRAHDKQVQKAHSKQTHKPIGVITHFFGGIKVAIVKFKKPMKVGATVRISGATTNFVQKITSMQYEHEAIKIAKKGKSVGMKVSKKVREGDVVYEEK